MDFLAIIISPQTDNLVKIPNVAGSQIYFWVIVKQV